MSLTKAQSKMYGQFVSEFPFCWACAIQPINIRELGVPGWLNRLENAHIVGGAGREADRRAIIRLCDAHHRAQHGERLPFSKTMVVFGLNIENMLWLKQKFDPEFYDLDYTKGLRTKKHAPIKPKRPPSTCKVHRDNFANPPTYMEQIARGESVEAKEDPRRSSRDRIEGSAKRNDKRPRNPKLSGPDTTKKEATFGRPVTITITGYRKRLADSDGQSAKAAIDGLVHAGVLNDDSPKWVNEVRYRQVKAKEEKTVILIEEF